MELLDELERRVVCGDGAIGTVLLNAGVPIERCLEELCVSERRRIQRIHEDYIAAGAEVIQTNTFGANAIRLGRFGMEHRVTEINRAAVTVARKAIQNKDVWIAGSVGPLGISPEEAAAGGIDRGRCFREQITALLDAAVDLIFFQTFTDLAEMEIALGAKQKIGGSPEICSFACGPGGRLRCDATLVDALAKLRGIGAKIVGVNCMNDPREMAALLQQSPTEGSLAVYPTAGNPTRQDGRLLYDVTPESFAAFTRDLVGKGARLLGGCCGTTPAHIAALAKTIRDFDSR
jgi:methionine synthase / methylenetetrahydrofolate reductase(NADPH)